MSDNRQTPHVIALILLFLAITLLTIVGFVSRSWMPPVASEHGPGVDGVIRYLLITTGLIFVIGHVVLIVFIWKYARGRPTGSPHTGFRTERLWSIVPVIGMAVIAEGGVLVLGLPVWEQVYGEVPEDAEVIEVTARQFEWLIRYPGPDGEFGRVEPELISGQTNPVGLDQNDAAARDDIVLRNRLHLPLGRAAHLLLRSHDVLHSITVPAFRIKQDIVPGIVGSTQFVPTETGEFEIGCAELCGLAHYRMRGVTVVHTESEYQAWLQEQTGSPQ